MLEHARKRGLEVYEADATKLPFDDASFDVTVSFKVLAHVERIGEALAEMARVTRPGGRVIAEFYNAKSVRTLVKKLKPSNPIGPRGEHTDDDVYTRYDTFAGLLSILPAELSLAGVDGIRVLSPAAAPFNVPVLGRAWAVAERAAMRTPLKRFGGFLVLHLNRA
jgi:SAM-dependent methyltransferase